jgi:hypothetical protein
MDYWFALDSRPFRPASKARRAASERGSNSAAAILSMRLSRSGLTRRVSVASLQSDRSSIGKVYHNCAPCQLTNPYHKKKCIFKLQPVPSPGLQSCPRYFSAGKDLRVIGPTYHTCASRFVIMRVLP